jgi:predicted extracellular nuclease
MFRTQGSLTHKVALAGLITLGLTSAASAQTATPSSGLGQSWPNATDVSSNPNWHVYVFALNGIKYIQVNDLDGNVHAAVGTAGGTTIVLPVGVDAQNVSTQAPASTSSTDTVYSDSSTTVTATPQSNGTTQFNALSKPDCDTYNCGGGRHH